MGFANGSRFLLSLERCEFERGNVIEGLYATKNDGV